MFYFSYVTGSFHRRRRISFGARYRSFRAPMLRFAVTRFEFYIWTEKEGHRSLKLSRGRGASCVGRFLCPPDVERASTARGRHVCCYFIEVNMVLESYPFRLSGFHLFLTLYQSGLI